MAEDPRVALARLVAERGEDYASLSRLIGRNAAYLQQYVKRGSPKLLAEADRKLLADYLAVPESLLGGPEDEGARLRLVSASAPRARREADLVLVPVLEIGASAGPGGMAEDERARTEMAFPGQWLRELAGGSFAGLSIIRVKGDSMEPTLADGDHILVDRSDAAERLRDGIYVIRVEEALIVKRLALNLPGGRTAILSDNPRSPAWPDYDPRRMAVIGRVVWAGRRVG
ncbi:peptidase S24 [Sphingomonas oleivorans]|uniref:Peptidase S24 n=1 Tax=Sphingomonas oleivorans TaxID=1735121 RepID=A0A2T5FVW2_9SPHN|nr:S24 family peptidase [Sphingomonas oleivorans]PTQ09916.1 peptidase S24 [Sphingomonas oleivorans]